MDRGGGAGRGVYEGEYEAGMASLEEAEAEAALLEEVASLEEVNSEGLELWQLPRLSSC